ncbi:MAG TPA: hypothetical protein VHF89_10785 [Solirubrobacteraceae bacterium]|nr:hypothetical protein [Solirubrobacteraceae bacterium]
MAEQLGSLLDAFENEPNLLLAISSDPNIDPRHHGNTSLKIGKPGQQVGLEAGAAAYMPLVRAGAPATITVAVSYHDDPGTIAHTINHELAMHATKFLELVRFLRTGPSDDEAAAKADSLVGDVHHVHHAEIKDPSSRVNVTHEAMVEHAEAQIIPELQAAHFRDASQYDEEGHYKRDEDVRAGHAETDYWLFPRLAETSALFGLAVDAVAYVRHRGVPVRAERTSEETFRIWFEAGQRPYNVKVGAPAGGSERIGDVTYRAAASIHPR